MYLAVDKEIFTNYIIQLFPTQFTREGVGILFEYIERSEERSGIEEEFDPQQIQSAYAESTYSRLITAENRFEDQIGAGKALCSNISVCARSLKELQLKVRKYIEESNAICIGFTSDKTVVYTRNET